MIEEEQLSGLVARRRSEGKSFWNFPFIHPGVGKRLAIEGLENLASLPRDRETGTVRAILGDGDLPWRGKGKSMAHTVYTASTKIPLLSSDKLA